MKAPTDAVSADSDEPKKSRRATQPGPRSLDVLDWIVRVGCTTPEPLSRALGLSIWTTYSHVQRLEAVEWIERVPTLRGGAYLIYPTRKGIAQVDRPWLGHERRVPSQWQHYRDVAYAAAWLSTHPACQWWRHEREFAEIEPPAEEPRGPQAWTVEYLALTPRGGRVRRTRRPDLVAKLDRRLTAVEVERTVKGADRLDRITAAWGGALQRGNVDRVLYIVPADSAAERAVRASIARSREVAPAITGATFGVLTLEAMTEAMNGRTVPAGSKGTGGAPDAEPPPSRAHLLDTNED